MGNNSGKKETKQSSAPVRPKLAEGPKATRVISKRLAVNHNQTLLVD